MFRWRAAVFETGNRNFHTARVYELPRANDGCCCPSSMFIDCFSRFRLEGKRNSARGEVVPTPSPGRSARGVHLQASETNIIEGKDQSVFSKRAPRCHRVHFEGQVCHSPRLCWLFRRSPLQELASKKIRQLFHPSPDAHEKQRHERTHVQLVPDLLSDRYAYRHEV